MFDFQKALKDAGDAIGGAVNTVANEAGKALADFNEKRKQDAIKADLRKYNPVFPQEYTSPDFGLPNVIVIVDDAVRKDIEVCKGAIGWKSKENDVEMLHLYDEFINDCGLQFIPAPICDTVYYVDPHDRTHFISFDRLFTNIQEQMVAELCNIAHCLGAKYYSIELEESQSSNSEYAQEIGGKKGPGLIKANVNAEYERADQNRRFRKSITSGSFGETKDPVRPELVWFKHHKYINEIINVICSGERTMNEVNASFNGEDYSVMSRTMASKVDAAIGKLGFGHNYKVHAQVEKAASNRMLLHLEF